MPGWASTLRGPAPGPGKKENEGGVKKQSRIVRAVLLSHPSAKYADGWGTQFICCGLVRPIMRESTGRKMTLFKKTRTILTDSHFLIPLIVFCIGLALLITLH
jgi:hypothetical protein